MQQLILAKTPDLLAQGMLIAADPGPTETLLAFLFIATAIMGTLQDFLKAFDKK